MASGSWHSGGGGTNRTRPRTDGAQHVRAITMEQDTPGIAVAPVGGWTRAASAVPLEKWGSIWQSSSGDTRQAQYPFSLL